MLLNNINKNTRPQTRIPVRSKLYGHRGQWLFLFLTNTIHLINVDLMLFQSLRCWRDSKTALGRNLVHSGYLRVSQSRCNHTSCQ